MRPRVWNEDLNLPPGTTRQQRTRCPLRVVVTRSRRTDDVLRVPQCLPADDRIGACDGCARILPFRRPDMAAGRSCGGLFGWQQSLSRARWDRRIHRRTFGFTLETLVAEGKSGAGWTRSRVFVDGPREGRSLRPRVQA